MGAAAVYSSAPVCFNEAAADAAEFSMRWHCKAPYSNCFNEAAADAAEFFRSRRKERSPARCFNEAAADAAEFSRSFRPPRPKRRSLQGGGGRCGGIIGNALK